MSLRPDDSAWLDDSLLVPTAGRIWPWVLVSLMGFLVGLYLLIPVGKENRLITAPRGKPILIAPEVPVPPVHPKGLWTLAFVDSSSSSFAQYGRMFSKQVEAKTQDRVKIELAPRGMVGKKQLAELGIIQAVQSGEIEMAIVTSSPLSNVLSDFEVLDLPFLFRDDQHADDVMMGPIGTKMLADLKQSGLIGLATLEIGFRIMSSSKPMPTLLDFKDKKVRVMQSSTAIAMAHALGCQAVPSAVDKIYQMGKQGYIDAADRTYPTFWDFKLYEVQHFITESRHSYSVKVLIANPSALHKLSPADQQVISSVALALQEPQRDIQRAEDARVKKDCLARGIQIYVLGEKERQQFVDACQPLFEEYRKLRGPALLDAIRNTP